MALTQKTHLLSRDFEWFRPSEAPHHRRFKTGVLSSFDGVHRQHQELLQHVMAETPDHDPSQVLVLVVDTPGGDWQEELLSLGERVLLIRNLIGDTTAFVRIDGDITKGNHKVQREQLALALRHVDRLIPGLDVLADQPLANSLAAMASAAGIPFQAAEANGTSHDSTHIIKDAIARGDMRQANRLLGYAYALEGHVVTGNMIGRTLGYPTANLKPLNPHQVIPGQGVYAAMVNLEGEWHPGMINIGIRPTLDLNHVTIEGHLLDFHGDLYGREIGFYFLERMRDEMRFSSLSHLKEQLRNDRQATESKIKELRQQYAPSDNWLMMSQQ